MEQPACNPSLQLNGSVDSFTAAQVVAEESQAAQLRRRHPGTDDPHASPKVLATEKNSTIKRSFDPFDDARYKSDGFWRDLRTGKWMLVPSEIDGSSLGYKNKADISLRVSFFPPYPYDPGPSLPESSLHHGEPEDAPSGSVPPGCARHDQKPLVCVAFPKRLRWTRRDRYSPIQTASECMSGSIRDDKNLR